MFLYESLRTSNTLADIIRQRLKYAQECWKERVNISRVIHLAGKFKTVIVDQSNIKQVCSLSDSFARIQVGRRCVYTVASCVSLPFGSKTWCTFSANILISQVYP